MMEEKKKPLKVPVECYSRIVGYFRPISQWNKGQREQFHNRKVLNGNFLKKLQDQ